MIAVHDATLTANTCIPNVYTNLIQGIEAYGTAVNGVERDTYCESGIVSGINI